MKMEQIVSSETSASNTQTPGIYPKESELYSSTLYLTSALDAVWVVNATPRPF
jgi:hypothetical protein